MLILTRMSGEEMNEDEWYETYKPIKNHLDKNASWNGEMFETYGEEVEFVISQPNENIWTWVEAEGGTYLLSGYYFVNRMGYIICSVPWTEEAIEITIDEPEEYCDECGDRREDCTCECAACNAESGEPCREWCLSTVV
jgi:hypothetical protein